MIKWLIGALAALVLLVVLLGLYNHYQGNTIRSQATELQVRQEKIDALEKSKKVATEVAKKNKKALANLETQTTNLKQRLKDALEDDKCAAAPIPDSASGLLNEIYR